jgi:cytochrome c553
MGLASYPKIQGKEVAYLTDRLQTYRSGKRIGPNSDLMIMMAMPLSDEEIENLAAYLSSVPIK